MLELWGKTAAQVLNKPVFEGIPDAKDQGFEQLLDNVYKTGKRFVAHELPISLSRQGNIESIFVKFVYEQLREEDGTISGIMTLADDVTEQVLARKKIEESEERLRLATETTKLGTWEFLPLTGQLTWSDECKRIYAFPLDKEVDYALFYEHIYPADKNFAQGAIEKAMEPGGTGSYDIEYRILRFNDKSVRWIRAQGKVFFDIDKKPARFIGTVLDITEAKLKEEVLRENEERLRLAIEAGSLGTYELDIGANNIIFSPRLAEIFGLDPSKQWGHQDLKNCLHPDDVYIRNKAHIKAKETGFLFYEARVIWPDGSIHWLRLNGTVMYDDKGKAMRTYGTAVDITEQKQSESILKESEQKFRQLADSMPQIVWTARPDGYLDYYNKKWYEFTGFDEGIGGDNSWVPILHTDDVQFCTDTWYNSVKTGKPYQIEYRFRNRKEPGTYCWYLGKALPIYNSEGKIIKWYGTCTDINDQKETEALLKESEEKFRLMADAMPQQVWTANAEGELDYVNRRTVNYFGKTAEQIVGSGWQEVIHPNDLPTVLESWSYSLKTLEPYQVEFRLRGKNDVYRWHLGRATPFFNKYKEVKWFGTNTDIEEHKFTEQKKDEFISIASHELKTPITSLKGIAYVLKTLAGQQEDSQVSKLLNTMDSQLSKLTKLISDLLDVNKIEGHHLQLNKEDFDFKDMVKETVESVQHTSPQHSLVIESNESVIFNGDKLRLEQVITNLLTNAVKYSPNAEKVIISYDITDDNIVVSVQDFGIGIERENITKLFERFYRVNNALRFGGLGLGLYISAGIIKSHNGNFWIESEVGKGSTFYFLLPRNKSQQGKNIQTDNYSYYADEQVKINYNKEH
ncbi:MAG: PAS domain-containing protein, partial [Chitinophagaceae bacterium]